MYLKIQTTVLRKEKYNKVLLSSKGGAKGGSGGTPQSGIPGHPIGI